MTLFTLVTCQLATHGENILCSRDNDTTTMLHHSDLERNNDIDAKLWNLIGLLIKMFVIDTCSILTTDVYHFPLDLI